MGGDDMKMEDISAIVTSKAEDMFEAYVLSWYDTYNFDRGLPAERDEIGDTYFLKAYVGDHPFIPRMREPPDEEAMVETGIYTLDRAKWSDNSIVHVMEMVRAFDQFFFFFQEDPKSYTMTPITEEEFWNKAYHFPIAPDERIPAIHDPEPPPNAVSEKIYRKLGERFRYTFIGFRDLLVMLNFNMQSIPESSLDIPYLKLHRILDSILAKDDVKKNKKTARNIMEELHYELDDNLKMLRETYLDNNGLTIELKKSMNRIKDMSNEFRAELCPKLFTQEDADWMI